MNLATTVRAVLVQDIHEVLAVLHEAFTQALEPYASLGFEEEVVVKWVVDEYLRRFARLSNQHHDYHHKTLQLIYENLDDYLYCPLHTLLSYNIGAPALYEPLREVTTEIRGQNLYIWYYKPV